MSPEKQLTHQEYLSLIYTIFNAPNGKLLLDIWTEQFLMTRKIANEGDDYLSIGIKQGEAQFVLSINQLLAQSKEEQ